MVCFDQCRRSYDESSSSSKRRTLIAPFLTVKKASNKSKVKPISQNILHIHQLFGLGLYANGAIKYSLAVEPRSKIRLFLKREFFNLKVNNTISYWKTLPMLPTSSN